MWRFSRRCAYSHWRPLFSHEALNVGENHARNSSRCVRAFRLKLSKLCKHIILVKCNTFIRGVMVHVFLPNIFGIRVFWFGIHEYRTTTACFNHCMSGTSLETYSFIYCYFWWETQSDLMSLFSGNSLNKCRFDTLWCGAMYKHISSNSSTELEYPFLFTIVLMRNKHEWTSPASRNRSISFNHGKRFVNKFTSSKSPVSTAR